MVADKIEMSLDDIIKNTKTMSVNKRGGAGGARRGGPAKGGSTRGGSARNGAPVRRQSGGGGGRGDGGVQKGRSRGGGIAKPKFQSRGDVNSAWKHDMFDGPRRRSSGGAPGTVGGAGSGATGVTKLLISNLDFGVSESDIRELFADFGNLRSASVHYDRTGRSLGTAHVIFERRGDAVKAMKQYNNVPLDGRPMSIQLPTSELPAPPSSRVGGGGGAGPRGAVGNKSFSPRNSRPMRGGGRGGPSAGGARRGGPAGGGGGAKRAPKPSMTAEQLDAELDAYVKDMK